MAHDKGPLCWRLFVVCHLPCAIHSKVFACRVQKGLCRMPLAHSKLADSGSEPCLLLMSIWCSIMWAPNFPRAHYGVRRHFIWLFLHLNFRSCVEICNVYLEHSRKLWKSQKLTLQCTRIRSCQGKKVLEEWRASMINSYHASWWN